MPYAVPVACSMPRCPRAAVFRGKCDVHRQTTTERGYGREHEAARDHLASTLPAPCGYCGRVIRPGERWVAAHRVDGHPEYGWMVSHGACNERAKGGAGSRRVGERALDDPRGISRPLSVGRPFPRRPQVSRSCRNCGRPIGSRSGQARHCSDACRQAYADAAKKQRRVIAPCRICGAPPETRHSRYCSAHKPYQTEYQRRRRANGGRPLQVVSTRSCARCGVEFASPVHDKRYCSRRCQQAALRGWISYRRFPKIRAAERRVICKRDRWRCGICHAVIDPALRFPHPGSASIDHVDPFGPHEPSNWQAAHLACNVQAGRKGRKAAA